MGGRFCYIIYLRVKAIVLLSGAFNFGSPASNLEEAIKYFELNVDKMSVDFMQIFFSGTVLDIFPLTFLSILGRNLHLL